MAQKLADYLQDALDLLDYCDEGKDGRCTIHRSDWAEGENQCEWYIDAQAALRTAAILAALGDYPRPDEDGAL